MAHEANRGGVALAAPGNHSALGASVVCEEVVLVHAGGADTGGVAKLAALYLGAAGDAAVG